MTNDELKKKIENLLHKEIEYVVVCGSSVKNVCIEHIADALIAAGIGDVKEAEIERKAYEVASNHYRIQYEEQKDRAEVAERALRNAATRLKCRGGLGKGFCRVDKCNYYHCNNDNGCIKAHLEQAEKELAVERKDD